MTGASRLALTLDRPDDGADEVRRRHEQERARVLRAARRRRADTGTAAAD